MMEMIKADIAKVISKYMKIDTQSMEIQISKTGSKGHEGKMPTLYANIPILDLHNK
jgi:cell division topological specificity factor